MDKFSNGEKVYSKTLKEFVFIKEPANYHTPTLYICGAMPDSEEYAFYEDELMSVFEHDKHFGLRPDSLF